MTALAGTFALAGALALSGSGAIFAQTGGSPTPAGVVSPNAVPSARFFGTVTSASGTSVQGASVTATIGGVTCGTGTVTSGQYTLDIQAIPGCTTPGATVNFSVNGQPATQTGQLPAIQGTAVSLNLTVSAATPTPAAAAPSPPPPPPTRPSTPPPPPATRPPASPTAIRTAVVPTSPPRTGLGGTSQQKPVAPAAQKPAAPAARGAVVVLPNTGTGGGTSNSALLGMLALAAALGASAAGALVLARRRA